MSSRWSSNSWNESGKRPHSSLSSSQIVNSKSIPCSSYRSLRTFRKIRMSRRLECHLRSCSVHFIYSFFPWCVPSLPEHSCCLPPRLLHFRGNTCVVVQLLKLFSFYCILNYASESNLSLVVLQRLEIRCSIIYHYALEKRDCRLDANLNACGALMERLNPFFPFPGSHLRSTCCRPCGVVVGWLVR